MRWIGVACLVGAVVAALIAFGVIDLWGYDTDASYQAYSNGRAIGGLRAGSALEAESDSAVSVLIIPLLLTGGSLLRISRLDAEARAEARYRTPIVAIAGGVIGLVAYVGFFAQFVEEGDLWLGNPLVVMWLPVIGMLLAFIMTMLPTGSEPQTDDTARQGLKGALALVGLLTVTMLALMGYGLKDGFIPMWAAATTSAFMLGVTLLLAVTLARRSHRH